MSPYELGIFDNSELFFISRVFFGAIFGAAGFEALDQFFGILHLGLMLENRLKFGFPHVSDIKGHVWLHAE